MMSKLRHAFHTTHLFRKVNGDIFPNQSKRFYADDPRWSKGIVLGLYQKEGEKEPKLTPSAEKFDDRVQGKLSELIKECNLMGYLGQGKVFNNLDPDFRSVALVGVGREGIAFNELEMLDVGMENVRVAAGIGARSLQMQGCEEVYVDSMDYPEQAAEGAALAIYRYFDHRRKRDRMVIPKLDAYDSSDFDSWTRGLFKAEAQNLARRLSDAPANIMTPTSFAQAAIDALCPCGVTVEIRTLDWIEQQQLHSLLLIAKGSCEPPVMLEITYCGTNPEDKPILLVGKGITYNMGGINLRRCKDNASVTGACIDEYRGSMSGGAVVVAAVRAAAALSLPINISAVVPLCENMISGMACKPGDVVRLMNGKSLAIRDLDLAGISVIADPLLYAQNTYKPRLVVDVATLGEGVKKALGGGATGIFSNSHYIWKQFMKAGSLTGDRMWRFPLWEFYKYLVCCDIGYDLSNNGYGYASSCLAAASLHELVPCVDWAHLDTKGVGMITDYGTVPYLLKGQMTGRPTRTLIQFLYQMACPDQAK